MYAPSPVRPVLAFLLGTLLFAANGSAQGTLGPSGPASGRSLYVVEFREEGDPPQLAGLGRLIGRIFELGGFHPGFASVRAVAAEPLCARPQPAAPDTSAAPAAQMRSGDYLITGSVRSDSMAFLVSVRVSRCAQVDSLLAAEPVHETSARIPWREALEGLAELVRGARERIEDDHGKSSIQVGPIEVNGSGPLAEELVEGAVPSLVEALIATDNLEVAERGGRYGISGTIRVATGRATARLRLYRADRTAPLDSVVAVQPEDSIYGLYRRLASAISRRVESDHAYENAALGAPLRTASRDSLVTLARVALACSGKACATPRGAETALELASALGERESSATVLHLLGRAELGRGRYTEAISALDSAWATWQRTPRAPMDEGVEILNSLADAYAAAGNPERAAFYRELSLTRDPAQPAAIARLAQDRQVAGESAFALRLLREGLRRYPREAALRTEFLALVREVDESLLELQLQPILQTCGVDAELRTLCAEILASRALVAFSASPPAGRAESVARGAIALAPADSASLLSAYALLASSALGIVLHVDRPNGESQISFPRLQRDSVEKYIGLAEAVSDGAGRPWQRDWVLRTEAFYRISLREYERALELARRASLGASGAQGSFTRGVAAYLVAQELERPPTPAARRERATALYREAFESLTPAVRARLGASYRYYRSAAHHLGLEAAAQSEIQAIVEEHIHDRQARNALSYLCLEYPSSPDAECAYRMFFRADSARALTTATDSLGLAELAALSGRYPAAAGVLAQILGRLPTDCGNAVAAFYRAWISDDAAFPAAFEQWSGFVRRHREARGGVCWVFDGAQRVLARPPPHPRRAILGEMAVAMETAVAPIPRAPSLP